MRSRILLMLLTGLFVMVSGCSGPANCPVCGTTKAGAYTDIINIPVPEHNPNGEPGGPFNSFDISWVDPVHHLDYVSDRLGLAVVVVDTINNIAVNAIQGVNAVTGAGNQASLCDPSIPPIVDVVGNFTRFGCRNAPFHLISGFGKLLSVQVSFRQNHAAISFKTYARRFREIRTRRNWRRANFFRIIRQKRCVLQSQFTRELFLSGRGG